MDHENIYYSRPIPDNKWIGFVKSAPVPLLFGIIIPAILTCARPSGQDILFEWQRKLVEISYYVVSMIYLFFALKTSMEGRYPRALAYLLAPICAGVIKLTEPASCALMQHWQDVIWYESGIRGMF